MNEEHRINLVNNFLNIKQSYYTSRYWVDETAILLNPKGIFDIDLLIAEKKFTKFQAILIEIEKELQPKWSSNQLEIREFDSRNDCVKDFVDLLAVKDLDNIILNYVNQKLYEDFYEQFEQEHLKWTTLIENTVINEQLICQADAIPSLASSATEVITKACGITLYPPYKLKNAIQAAGFKVDQERIDEIIKKNKANNPWTVATSISALAQLPTIAAEELLPSQYTGDGSVINISASSELVTRFKNLVSAIDRSSSDATKVAGNSPMPQFDITPLTFAQTLEQLTGTVNHNPFATATEVPSFTVASQKFIYSQKPNISDASESEEETHIQLCE